MRSGSNGNGTSSAALRSGPLHPALQQASFERVYRQQSSSHSSSHPVAAHRHHHAELAAAQGNPIYAAFQSSGPYPPGVLPVHPQNHMPRPRLRPPSPERALDWSEVGFEEPVFDKALPPLPVPDIAHEPLGRAAPASRTPWEQLLRPQSLRPASRVGHLHSTMASSKTHEPGVEHAPPRKLQSLLDRAQSQTYRFTTRQRPSSPSSSGPTPGVLSEHKEELQPTKELGQDPRRSADESQSVQSHSWERTIQVHRMVPTSQSKVQRRMDDRDKPLRSLLPPPVNPSTLPSNFHSLSTDPLPSIISMPPKSSESLLPMPTPTSHNQRTQPTPPSDSTHDHFVAPSVQAPMSRAKRSTTTLQVPSSQAHPNPSPSPTQDIVPLHLASNPMGPLEQLVHQQMGKLTLDEPSDVSDGDSVVALVGGETRFDSSPVQARQSLHRLPSVIYTGSKLASKPIIQQQSNLNRKPSVIVVSDLSNPSTNPTKSSSSTSSRPSTSLFTSTSKPIPKPTSPPSFTTIPSEVTLTTLPQPVLNPSTPTRLRKTSKSPSSPSNQANSIRVRCSGIKKNGQRCTRLVSVLSPSHISKGKTLSSDLNKNGSTTPSNATDCFISDSDSDSDSDSNFDFDSSIEKNKSSSNPPFRSNSEFCFQHIQEINRSNGFVLFDGSLFQFSSYFVTEPISLSQPLNSNLPLPSVVSVSTAAKLREILSRPLRSSDLTSTGFIYMFQLNHQPIGTNSTNVLLKIGRTRNVYSRISQWRNQCFTHEPFLLGFYPGGLSINSSCLVGASLGGGSCLPGLGMVSPEGVPLSHLWEFLIHTELSDLSIRMKMTCQDCGRCHREIFCFTNSTYQPIVMNSILRWFHAIQTILKAYQKVNNPTTLP